MHRPVRKPQARQDGGQRRSHAGQHVPAERRPRRQLEAVPGIDGLVRDERHELHLGAGSAVRRRRRAPGGAPARGRGGAFRIRFAEPKSDDGARVLRERVLRVLAGGRRGSRRELPRALHVPAGGVRRAHAGVRPEPERAVRPRARALARRARSGAYRGNPVRRDRLQAPVRADGGGAARLGRARRRSALQAAVRPVGAL